MTDQIRKSVDALRHTAVVAGLNYEIWWLYKGAETRPLYLERMKRYSPFFQTSIHAHFVALIVALYRLYETRKDTHNISLILDLLEKKGALEAGVLASLRGRYDALKPLWIKVSILRNNVFGHDSLEYSEGEAFAVAQLTPDDLRDLWLGTCDLLNELTHAWDKSVHAFNLGSRDALIRMFEDLSR